MSLNSESDIWSPLPVASRMCGDFFAGQYVVKGLSEEGRPYGLDWVFPDNDHYWFVIFDSYSDSQVNFYLNTVKVAPVSVLTYSTSYVLLTSTVSGSTISSKPQSTTTSQATIDTSQLVSVLLVIAAMGFYLEIFNSS